MNTLKALRINSIFLNVFFLLEYLQNNVFIQKIFIDCVSENNTREDLQDAVIQKMGYNVKEKEQMFQIRCNLVANVNYNETMEALWEAVGNEYSRKQVAFHLLIRALKMQRA